MTATTRASMRDHFTAAAINLLDTNRRIVVVTADIGAARFASARRRHPDRVINVGIREQLLISTVAGFAMEGFRPIAHSYAPFLIERPYEQIKLDLGHQGVGAILVSTGASFDASAEGRTHQAPADVALMTALPGWEISTPGHADELDRILRRAARGTTNVYIRMSEQENRRPLPNLDVTVVHRGTTASPTVLAFGPMLDPVLEAAVGLDLTVLATPMVRPLDTAALRSAIAGTDVVVVEPFLEGTTAATISRALADRPHRVTHVGVGNREVRNYGSRFEHARAHGLDAAALRSTFSRLIDRG